MKTLFVPELLQPAFYLGSIPIMGRVMLAPMDGYTDHPFRLICRRLGSACTYSEFINAMDMETHHPYIGERLYFLAEERPFGYQILDNDPQRILRTAYKLCDLNPDFLDVNLGCCSRSVCSRGAGASLLLDPQKISHIIELLVHNIDLPITAKIRLGWADDERNYLEISKRVAEAGASALAVHGRTRIQAYSGEADWNAIAEVKQIMPIPVIGNGDVRTPADINRFLDFTSCDAVMIGRASIGNPWIFAAKDRGDITKQGTYQTLQEHLQASLEYYGTERGLMLFRKHAVEYLQNNWPSPESRRDVLTTSNPEVFLEKIKQIIFKMT
ncbi:MAG: tRNA-dihydrouridine synthase family protein [Leptolinea sp.]